MRDILPPFQVDYGYLTANAITTGHTRTLSASTIHMCIAALQAMHYNRYWIADDGFLSDEQIADKNDLVDLAIYELLEAAGIPEETINDIISNSAYGGGGACDESEEDMVNILWIKGTPYLVKDCGCSDAAFFQLTSAEVSIGDDGTISIGDTPDTGGITFPATEDSYKSCVGEAFVPYALQLAANYQSILVNVAATGIDVLSGWDELLDVAQLIARWLGGDTDLEDWSELVSSSVQQAFADEDYQDFMVGTFEAIWDGGPFTRQTLHDWIVTSPQFVDSIPVRWLADDWAQYCNLTSLNEQLMATSTSCAAGTGYTPDAGNPPPTQYEYSGTTYLIRDVSMSVTLPAGENPTQYLNSFDVPEEYLSEIDILGVFFQCRTYDIAGNQMEIQIGNGPDYKVFPGIENGTFRLGCSTSTADLVCEEYTGETWNAGVTNVYAVPPYILRRFGLYGMMLELQRMIIIGTEPA